MLSPGTLTQSTTAGVVAAAGSASDPVPAAAGLDGDWQSALGSQLAHALRTSYAPHEALYHEGGPCDTVYFITDGYLKLIIHLANGRARIVRLHRPGAVLCLGGLFDRSEKHTAVALTPVNALCLPVSAIHRLRADDPATYVGLLERWYRNLQEADIWIAQFSTGPIRSRVARLLSFLMEFEPDAADGCMQLLTCEEMGSILGVRSESVSRVLAEFKRQHILVDKCGAAGKLYKPDLDQLRHIADE